MCETWEARAVIQPGVASGGCDDDHGHGGVGIEDKADPAPTTVRSGTEEHGALGWTAGAGATAAGALWSRDLPVVGYELFL